MMMMDSVHNGLISCKAAFCLAMGICIMSVIWRVVSLFWVSPIQAHRKLKRNGFTGPPPSFPMGNINEMIRKQTKDNIDNDDDKMIILNYKQPAEASSTSAGFPDHHQSITHDIHSTVFPYFSRWRKSYGKVFMYWLGTEPFLYIADPEFIKQMSSGVMGKSWGKPKVFRDDRKPMFGNGGLVMVEGNDWVHHRQVLTPAFLPANLKGMANLMVDSATKMLDQWSQLINDESSGSGKCKSKIEIDVEKDILRTTAEIIAKASFGMKDDENGRRVFEKLRALQMALFKSNRLVGVPFSRFMYQKKFQEARRLGKEIDEILLSIIKSRIASPTSCSSTTTSTSNHHQQQDLLGVLLAEDHGNDQDFDEKKKKVMKLPTRELVDECKTLFFGGNETTALALTWTLLLLALNPQWQTQLRQEITEVIGDGPFDPTLITKLKKMGWVMNEVIRLYSPAPNVQRQAREDIQVGNLIIPNGTNMWIDVVGMNHDPSLWGEDVNEFKPERFKDDTIHGGCKHKMGFLPFGFGGRMCVGRNLTIMEYKIVLTLILTRFSFSLSPNYSHSPAIMLSLRPSNGLPLIFQHL